MSQELALSMLTLGVGGTGKEQVGQLKLPLLPKDESQFFLWKMKVQSTIEGIGASDVINHTEAELHQVTLQRILTYQSDRVLLGTLQEEKKVELKTLTQEQKDILKARCHKVYAALA
jgi:hypothetical protein